MSKQTRVPETKQEMQRVQIPMQIILHEAGLGVQKIAVGQEYVYELNFVSPVGIAVTITITEEAKDNLIKQLTGVELASSQALRELTGI